MTKYPFTDLHSFKDYVGFVKLCAPDQFPPEEGISAEDQWTLDYAFHGLRHGLSLAVEEKGENPVFERCRQLVEEAYKHYKIGNMREGFVTLDVVSKLLKKVPSH